MKWLRWQTFKFLSVVGWRISPEPHRSNLQAVMPEWRDIDEERIGAALEGAMIRELEDHGFLRAGR